MAEGGSLPSGGTSRVNREVYARFCERLRVKFPGPTRRIACPLHRCAYPRSGEGLLISDHLRSNRQRGGKPPGSAMKSLFFYGFTIRGSRIAQCNHQSGALLMSKIVPRADITYMRASQTANSPKPRQHYL